MCFSFEISLGTFIFSWGVSFYLLNKKLTLHQKQNIIFLMIFSTMQLLDAILWYINLKKNIINKIITRFLIPLLLISLIYYNLFVINNIKNNIARLFIIIYIVSFFLVFQTFTGLSLDYSTKSKNYFKSPIWGGKEINNPFILVVLFYLIGYGRIGFKGEKLHHLLVGISTILLSYMFTGGYGSLWCFFANILAIYYLFKY